MNLFETATRRKILFSCLYLSEGAPIGFIWLALPTRLRASDIPIGQITWLGAILVLPWTFKFAWAPLVDLLRGRRWTFKHWIVTAQLLMGLTLLPLIWLDPMQHFQLLTLYLLLHALSAATQDVAIDALCISVTNIGERGQYNGWMQAGMLLGRAMMGGGALVLAQYLGDSPVIILLIVITTFSMVLLLLSTPPPEAELSAADRREHWLHIKATLRAVVTDTNTWIGLLFAATGGAAFKSLEVFYGPFLVDRGYDQETIGWFSVGPMIGAMIAGAIFGGLMTDRLGSRRCVAASLMLICTFVIALAVSDWLARQSGGSHLFIGLAMTAFAIGTFTASSYALFMDISRPGLAASQFSAFMGATNGCESWSSYASGKLITHHNYATAMVAMSLLSLVSLPLIAAMRPMRKN